MDGAKEVEEEEKRKKMEKLYLISGDRHLFRMMRGKKC